MNIYPIIVVYNKSIKESKTLMRLKECNVPNENIIVVDNSTLDFGIKEYCEITAYKYISMQGNKGLSKAYNCVLDNLNPMAAPDDILIWLDDDTDVTKEYFDMLRSKSISLKSIDIFAPIIIGQDGVIYSPNEGHFFGSKFMKSPDADINMNKFNGINSCLAVRNRIYDNYRYTEELFMDLTDNQFFDDMRKRNVRFCILRTCINQSFFQRGDNLDANQLIARIRIKFKDFMIYANNKGKIYLFAGLIKCVGWGIVLGMKTKSPKMFFYCCFKGTKEFIRNL